MPGLINTVVLIGSSLTMALSVRAAQTNQRKATVNWLIATIILGSLFLGIKVYEYSPTSSSTTTCRARPSSSPSDAEAAGAEAAHEAPAAAGHAVRWAADELQRTTQIFFSLYFMMTGLHAIHMIVGVVILFVIRGWRTRGASIREYHAPVEMTGLYWHFVDIVWIFLFPLLYLVERHD